MENHEGTSNKVLWIIISVLGALVIFLAGIIAGYLYFNYTPGQITVPEDVVISSDQIQQPTISEPVNTITDEESEVEQEIRLSETMANTKTKELFARWNTTLKEVASLDVFKENASEYVVDETFFYESGKVTSGGYANATIYIASIPCEGPCFYPLHYRFLQTTNGDIIYLEKHSPELDEYDSLDRDKFLVEKEAYFAELTVPETIEAGALPVQLVRDEHVREIYSPENTEVAFTGTKVGTLLQTKNYDDTFDSIYDRYGFYARAVDGSLLVYSLKPKFISEDGIPSIVFSDGTKNEIGYNYTTQGGCGSINYAAVTPDSIVSSADLVKVGQTGTGDSVYELKDKNHQLLKEYYEDKYYAPDDQKISYEEFVASYPILFYTDELNRRVKLESRQFVPQAECGKPVIYLYPEEATNVHVEVAPQGGFSYTDPVYNGGWDVLAQPDGRLTELSSGLEYPYLFWEGDGGIYTEPTKGWVVEQQEVETFLIDSLIKLGLNSQEIADFNEFWLPRMQSEPYYFISFYGTSVMDDIAPLDITPQPDTIIRVLMDYRGLEKPIDVEPYPLRSIPRKGFTVIEWGGVIR